MFFFRKEIYLSILSLVVGIIISTFIWEHIKLDFVNDEEIIGQYSLYAHHSLNDTLRYIFFISFPIFLFLITFFLTKNPDYYKNFSLNIFLLDSQKGISKKNNFKTFLLISFLAILIFIINDFSIGQMDVFEAGISLSGSTLLENKLSPWVDVYINTGFFYDMLLAKTSWMFTGFKSVGSYNFFKEFLNLLSIISLIYFFYEVSKSFQDQFIKNNFFLITSFFLILYLDNLNIWRDLPLIIFLISILNFINAKKNSSIIVISFLSVFTFFWSLDRGFFIFFLLIPFLIFVLINDKKEFVKFIITISIFCLILTISIDKNILKNFLIHTQDIFFNHEKLNGIIHPSPFSDDLNSSRATKSLILLILNFVISFLLIFRKKSIFNNNTKFIFLFFSIMNFIIYKSALSRSDGPHIKEATYFSIILLSVFLILFVISYSASKKSFIRNQKKIKFSYIIIFLIIIFQNKNISNIFVFSENYKKLVSSQNHKFLDDDYNETVKFLGEFFKNEECLQAFTYDQAIFYLVDKKSCSKFYNVWVIGSKNNQLDYINELKNKRPKFLLKGGNVNFQSLSERYPYINKYILKEYILHKKIEPWSIYIKNQN